MKVSLQVKWGICSCVCLLLLSTSCGEGHPSLSRPDPSGSKGGVLREGKSACFEENSKLKSEPPENASDAVLRIYHALRACGGSEDDVLAYVRSIDHALINERRE